MENALTKEEDLKYQLETLSGYEAKDIDNPEFEVAYEVASGKEGFATVCCIDLAVRSLKRINELEAELKTLKCAQQGLLINHD